jgi:hypothetical protein
MCNYDKEKPRRAAGPVYFFGMALCHTPPTAFSGKPKVRKGINGE